MNNLENHRVRVDILHPRRKPAEHCLTWNRQMEQEAVVECISSRGRRQPNVRDVVLSDYTARCPWSSIILLDPSPLPPYLGRSRSDVCKCVSVCTYIILRPVVKAPVATVTRTCF